MTRGLRNNNPLNIRINARNKWVGKVYDNKDGAFEQFESMRYGIRAAAVLIGSYYHAQKLTSIQDIVRRWAPPIENDTNGYIGQVCELTGYGGREKLRTFQLPDVLFAMAIIESGEGVRNYREEFYEVANKVLVDKSDII